MNDFNSGVTGQSKEGGFNSVGDYNYTRILVGQHTVNRSPEWPVDIMRADNYLNLWLQH